MIESKEILNFVTGMGFGGCLVILCNFLADLGKQWIKKNDLELDITLGKALLEIKEKLNNKPSGKE